MLPLRTANLEEEGTLQIAKQLKWHFLTRNMESLLSALPPFQIFLAGRFTDKPHISNEEFLRDWRSYLEDRSFSSPLFSSIWTSDSEAIFALKSDDKRTLVRPIKPVLQLRPHRYLLSGETIHSMVYGENTKSFGIEISYPAIYSTTKDPRVRKTLHENLPNNALYKSFVTWMRKNTRPCKIKIQDREVVTTIRAEAGCILN
ncbi:MAG: hypothetical protein SNF33_02680 [Candidatus Algichlamydia australiensis]|nr:hypothetical protein [Chlamydiales bacterium]